MLPSDRRKLQAGHCQVPLCALAVVEEALDRLRAAGFTGETTVVTLDPNRAYLDGAPGRVTATQPRTGELVAPGAGVTVYARVQLPRERLRRGVGAGELVAGMLDMLETGAWQITADGHIRRNHARESSRHLRFL
jgi:hypothetical protein